MQDDTDRIIELRNMKTLYQSYLASGGKITYCEKFATTPTSIIDVVEVAPKRGPGRPPKTVVDETPSPPKRIGRPKKLLLEILV